MTKMEEFRKLSTEELDKKIKENKEELFNLRFQQATGNLEKPVRLRELRKLKPSRPTLEDLPYFLRFIIITGQIIFISVIFMQRSCYCVNFNFSDIKNKHFFCRKIDF